MKDSGCNLCVEIYAPQKDLVSYGKLFREYTVVELLATLSASEVSAKLKHFDVLIHVESFLEIDSLYTRYSISTKIPQYMASGRPIIAYGPASLSSIRYIKNSEAGLVIDHENDIYSMKSLISKLLDSPDLRSNLGERGRLVATQSHNAVIERNRFRSVLEQAANSSLI
jgi:glycosyltransferase involved in cell wall biosynthesis